jgi:RHS repeat-associated protein
VGEYDASGNEIKTYGWQPNSTWSTDPLFMKQNGVYYYYRNDHLGTPMQMTDSDGLVVWEAKYDAFGKAAVDAGSTVTNNLRFPGQYYDSETGLHYNWHRYYNPETGRYLTPDPIGLAGGINLYQYANANPVNFYDPYGLFWDWKKLFGPATKYCTKRSIRPWLEKHVSSPAGQRIIMSGIQGFTGGFVSGSIVGGTAGAVSTGPLAGIGAIPGAFIGGTSGAFTGLATGLLSQTVAESLGIPDMIDGTDDCPDNGEPECN